MYCVIFTRGGLLIMMGQHARCESLFYYFKLDDYVPKNHLLWLIDEHVSFAFVRGRLKDSYGDTGRPSIALHCHNRLSNCPRCRRVQQSSEPHKHCRNVIRLLVCRPTCRR